MSRRLTPIAAAFAAVVVCALVASQGAMGARSCAAFDGRVLVLSETGRIISVRRPGFSIWYACLERHGRRVALGDHIPTGAEQLGRPLLAGSFAAFKRYRPSAGTTGPSAVVVDLGARRRASMHVDDGITGMVLSDRGDLVVTSPASVLHLRRGRPVATLDVGDITPSSLALSRNGRDAYWLNGRQPRSFVLPASRARAPEGADRRSCGSSRGRLLVLTKTARIVSVRGDGRRTWYACLQRRGTRVRLGAQLSRPMLAGTFAAFESGPRATVVDLRTRRRASMDVPVEITGMVLSSRGDLIVTSPGSVLRLRRGRPVAELDSGDIARGSLALSHDGRYAYWLNGGQPRSFTVR